MHPNKNLKNITIYGTTYSPKVGSLIVKEGKNIGELLLEGNSYVDSEFPGCDFYLPTGQRVGITKLAVNIEITGRTLQHPWGWSNGLWIKVRIEYVQDEGEPSIYGSGWMKA